MEAIMAVKPLIDALPKSEDDYMKAALNNSVNELLKDPCKPGHSYNEEKVRNYYSDYMSNLARLKAQIKIVFYKKYINEKDKSNMIIRINIVERNVGSAAGNFFGS
jgi:hypothetical protein